MPRTQAVVKSIFSNDTVKKDKVANVTGCRWASDSMFGKAHEGTLTIIEPVPMPQSALLLMGDASEHHSYIGGGRYFNI